MEEHYNQSTQEQGKQCHIRYFLEVIAKPPGNIAPVWQFLKNACLAPMFPAWA
jgi:hypothetical protein